MTCPVDETLIEEPRGVARAETAHKLVRDAPPLASRSLDGARKSASDT